MNQTQVVIIAMMSGYVSTERDNTYSTENPKIKWLLGGMAKAFFLARLLYAVIKSAIPLSVFIFRRSYHDYRITQTFFLKSVDDPSDFSKDMVGKRLRDVWKRNQTTSKNWIIPLGILLAGTSLAFLSIEPSAIGYNMAVVGGAALTSTIKPKGDTMKIPSSMDSGQIFALLKAIGLNDYQDAIKLGMTTGPIEELPPNTDPGMVKIDHQTVQVMYEDGVTWLEKPIPNQGMVAQFHDGDKNIESRYCLMARVNAMVKDLKCRSYHITGEMKAMQAFNKAAEKEDRIYGLLRSEGADLYGGTGANAGRFYGVKWKNHPFKLADEALGYLSLLFTPFAWDRNRVPLFYEDLNILVVSNKEFEKAGLIPGHGTVVTKRDLGQIRLMLDKTMSIGKGMAVGYRTLRYIGCTIPSAWEYYDLVICEDDIKINPVEPGEYDGCFGVTWNNVWTMKGQNVTLGFEFWQFLKADQGLIDKVVKRAMQADIPTWEEMVLGLEAKRAMAAIDNGGKYTPLALHSLIQEAVNVVGPTYPKVAEWLKKLLVNWLISRPYEGTHFRLVVTVNDRVKKHVYRYDPNGKTLALKYPVVAGLMRASGKGTTHNYMVLNQTLAEMYNIDSDGDCALTVDNDVSEYVCENDLVKEPRNIKVLSKDKYDLSLTLENMAILISRIMDTGLRIGRLTNAYYQCEALNDNGLTLPPIDLSVLFTLIEKEIKSAKHDMDLGSARRDVWKLYKVLEYAKEAVPMPFGNVAKGEIFKSINTPHDAKFEKYYASGVKTPLTYDHYNWNATIKRSKQEIAELDNNKVSLEKFSTMVGLIDIEPDDKLIPREIAVAKSALRLWSMLRPETDKIDDNGNPVLDSNGKKVKIPAGELYGRGADVARVLSLVGKTLSVPALKVAIRGYLKGAAQLDVSKQSGAAALHLSSGRMGEVFSNGLDYERVDVTPTVLVKAYLTPRPGLKKGVSFDMARNTYIHKGTGKLHVSRFVASLADDDVGVDLTGMKVRCGVPYIKLNGKPGWTVWVVLEPDRS